MTENYTDTFTHGIYSLNELIASMKAKELEFRHSLYEEWWTDDKVDHKKLGECLYSATTPKGGGAYVFAVKDSILSLTLNEHGMVTTTAHSYTLDETKAVNAYLKKIFKESVVKEDKIRVSFWHLGSQGPQETVRKLVAPRWKEIKGNYSTRTSDDIDALLTQEFDSESSGKLILWSGEPGTGKTYAIRALGQEWKHFADIHYVIDPEQFFGKEAGYLAQVLLDEAQGDKWRLIVLEDTGELLARDAKARTGQGLSRLLNVCDGLLGQGLKILVLITTNEELGSLHEAVSRSGRCAADTIFHPLTIEEVERWADMNKICVPSKSTTLAELFGIKSGESRVKRASAPVGFKV